MIAPSTTHEPITLTLTITDTECVSELMNRSEGGDREFFALSLCVLECFLCDKHLALLTVLGFETKATDS